MVGGSPEAHLKPDIVTLGKIVGCGFPIGVICGSEEIMQHANTSTHSKKTHLSKSVTDTFRPSINLNSILPSSNAFLPSRGNGQIFRELVWTHNNRDGGFLKESIKTSDNIILNAAETFFSTRHHQHQENLQVQLHIIL